MTLAVTCTPWQSSRAHGALWLEVPWGGALIPSSLAY